MKQSFQSFIQSTKNQKVVIWGLGLNQGGLGAALFFAKQGAKVVVVDLKTEKELANSVTVLRKFSNVKFFLGRQDEKCFEKADLVIKNQAIPWDNPLVKKLLKKGVAVEGDITLFFRFFKGKIVGITGSKGKTTTTTLIGEFLKRGGKDVLLGGNIRVSLFDFFSKKVLEDKNKIAVLELSSFQLEDLNFVKKSPHIAVVTNIYRDHLNRYGTLKKYIEAKKPICKFQKGSDFLILNKEDKQARKFSRCSEARTIVIPTGSRPLQWAGEAGESLKCAKRDPFDFAQEGSAQGGKIARDGSVVAEAIRKNEFFSSKNNQSNLAAALAVARIFKIKPNILAKVIKNFKGVPYRMEKIAVINKIVFYNDTAATIPDAAIGGINGIGHSAPLRSAPTSASATAGEQDDSRRVILISGGADKNLKFVDFAKTIAKKVKKVILLPGTATPLIEKALLKHAPNVIRAEAPSMDKAVKTAYKSASAGDVILLSPGCASFGLFKNEFDRGDQFNEAVSKLK